MRKLLLLALGTVVGIVSVASLAARWSGTGAPTSQPNLLLFTLDTTRADHTSAYGYARPTTPNLERLAREGVRFDVAYAPMASTLPSHATMFTGLLPRSHGATKNGLRVDPRLPILAETLTRNGYRTAAFVSSFAVDSSFGLDRGFASYDEDFRGVRCKLPNQKPKSRGDARQFCRRADMTRERAVAWLEKSGDLAQDAAVPDGAPFFLWVHFFDPHNPYDPPEPSRALFRPESDDPSALERQIARYDGEIHFADQEMGKLVDRLAEAGRLDDTLVVVVGDHGEGLMQHGWMLHGLQIYEEAVRVPFVMRWPGRLPSAKEIPEPVQLSDLTPTILELLGLDAPSGTADGRSLVPAVVRGEPLELERPVFLQRRVYATRKVRGVPVKGDKSAVRIGPWKYIEAKEEDSYELYDLESDPGESVNLHADKPARGAELASVLREWVAQRAAYGDGVMDVSPEAARRLKALGYVQ